VHDDGVFAARDDAKRLAVEAHAVERAGDAERLAEPAGPRAEETLVGEAAAFAHLRDPRGRLQRAEQYPRAVADRHADEVEAPVDAVRAIDVGAARRSEHHRVSCRVAGVAVRRRIDLVVRLGLDDRAADAVDEDAGADQLARDDERRGGEVDRHRGRIASAARGRATAVRPSRR